MAIAFVKSTGKGRATSNPDSVSISFGSLPAAANFVGVQALVYDNHASTDLAAGNVTDNQSNTYARDVRSPVYNTIGSDRIVCANYSDSSIGSPSGTFTITVNPAGTGSLGAIVAVATEWSGVATASALDQTGTMTGASGVTPSVSTSSTTTQADELVLGTLVCSDTGGGATGFFTSITVGGSYVERAEELDGDTYQAGEADSLIVSSTGTQTCSWTLTHPGTTAYATACISTYKAAAAAAAGIVHRQLLLGVGT